MPNEDPSTSQAPSRRRPAAALLLVVFAIVIAGGFILRRVLHPRRAMLAPEVVARQPIVPGVALGPVKLGMTQEQVTAALGKPDSIAGARNWQYRDPDLAVGWSKANPPTVIMIFGGGWPNLTNVPYRTAEGIGIASPVTDVTAAWGPAERESPETLGYPSRGVTVMHKEGKVVWLAVRAAAAMGASAGTTRPATTPVDDSARPE
jgi:hypothetical protein